MAEQATQPTKETPAPVANMTEAGFSMNVKLLDPFGSEVMLTFRAPLVQHADKLLKSYTTEIKILLDDGWRVSGARPAANGEPSGQGTPQCRIHNAQMRESKNRPGSYYCSKKVGDDYCKEKA